MWALLEMGSEEATGRLQRSRGPSEEEVPAKSRRGRTLPHHAALHPRCVVERRLTPEQVGHVTAVLDGLDVGPVEQAGSPRHAGRLTLDPHPGALVQREHGAVVLL